MKFVIQRETLLKPLQAIINIVEKKQASPILANVLLHIAENTLEVTATDLEIELVVKLVLEESAATGKMTLPAKKLFDIFKNLPDHSSVEVKADTAEKVVITSGKSRFCLAGLPADGFPTMQSQLGQTVVQVPGNILGQLIRKTCFAMAQQDVRYFLNGLLLEISEKMIRTVATDGHRLALASETIQGHAGDVHQVIIPRKTILELQRILENTDTPVTLTLGSHFIRIALQDMVLTSKLVDGRYPDYNRVIPSTGKNILILPRETFKHSLQRTSILSNEKYRGVRLNVQNNTLKLMANNPEQEQAEDELEVAYVGQDIEIGFNITYIMDVLNVLDCENVKITLTNNISSMVLHDPEDNRSVYVIMPIRL